MSRTRTGAVSTCYLPLAPKKQQQKGQSLLQIKLTRSYSRQRNISSGRIARHSIHGSRSVFPDLCKTITPKPSDKDYFYCSESQGTLPHSSVDKSLRLYDLSRELSLVPIYNGLSSLCMCTALAKVNGPSTVHVYLPPHCM